MIIGGILMSKFTGYIVLIFAFVINFVGFLGISFLVFPEDSEMVSGFLGFIGAIIGGLITFIGVKIQHIKERRNSYLI
jgi:hypothetical protein